MPASENASSVPKKSPVETGRASQSSAATETSANPARARRCAGEEEGTSGAGGRRENTVPLHQYTWGVESAICLHAPEPQPEPQPEPARMERREQRYSTRLGALAFSSSESRRRPATSSQRS